MCCYYLQNLSKMDKKENPLELKASIEFKKTIEDKTNAKLLKTAEIGRFVGDSYCQICDRQINVWERTCRLPNKKWPNVICLDCGWKILQIPIVYRSQLDLFDRNNKESVTLAEYLGNYSTRKFTTKVYFICNLGEARLILDSKN